MKAIRVHEFGPPEVLRSEEVADPAEIHAALWVGLNDGTLSPVVGRTLPLAQAAHAHHDISESAAIGKLALVP